MLNVISCSHRCSHTYSTETHLSTCFYVPLPISREKWVAHHAVNPEKWETSPATAASWSLFNSASFFPKLIIQMHHTSAPATSLWYGHISFSWDHWNCVAQIQQRCECSTLSSTLTVMIVKRPWLRWLILSMWQNKPIHIPWENWKCTIYWIS